MSILVVLPSLTDPDRAGRKAVAVPLRILGKGWKSRIALWWGFSFDLRPPRQIFCLLWLCGLLLAQQIAIREYDNGSIDGPPTPSESKGASPKVPVPGITLKQTCKVERISLA